MQEATIVELLREEAERTGDQDFSEAASLLERQQQVIDLLMKAVEPFAEMSRFLPGDGLVARVRITETLDCKVTGDDLRRAREAKVEAERILNHSHPGLEREE